MNPAGIAACKRLIDQYKQKRNDALEAIDEALLSEVAKYSRAKDARLNSETAGAMIDRLSILLLKTFPHARAEPTDRRSEDHVSQCTAKLQRLMAQHEDLASCLRQLFAYIEQGRALQTPQMGSA